ncbi:alpha/beta hydrolase [Nocardia vinacea]|uniref:Alpha/beta hydrolase n=1 Tax=Nocardia vinacea TaxID=96468 RepID=A0ABZ1Z1N0_9NOCA|nr:alpha/beta hydrolase [Nocardia vinacea]
MAETVVRIVETAGARLHTEAAGTGPDLVLISGGGGDAGMYEAVVPLLADSFRVITFDRRGNSRSPLTEPRAAIDVATQAADVIAVLDAYAIERAHIFGSSGAAIITLELLAASEDRLIDAIVHEPPLVQLLPVESPARQEIADIGALAVAKSPMRAFAAFGVLTMPNVPWILRSSPGQTLLAGASRVSLAIGAALRRITRTQPSTMTRQLNNADLLLRRELPAFCFDYHPDLAALRKVEVPWRLATGRESVDKPYYVAAHALADELGRDCVEFPGGHVPYQLQPEQFVARLVALFDEMSA